MKRYQVNRMHDVEFSGQVLPYVGLCIGVYNTRCPLHTSTPCRRKIRGGIVRSSTIVMSMGICFFLSLSETRLVYVYMLSC